MLRYYAEEGERQKLLDALNRQIGDGELTCPRYSESVLLNAILHTQFSRAAEAGVYVEYRLTGIPAKLPIEDADLVSLVTNALDNAVSAAEGAGREKWLHISIDWSEGTLNLHCANAKGQAPPQKRKGHGHGLSIMKGIAGRYGGGLETDDYGDSFEIHVRISFS